MIIIKKDSIIDLSAAEIIGLQLAYGKSNAYEVRAFFSGSNQGDLVCVVSGNINKKLLLQYFAENKYNHKLIMTEAELTAKLKEISESK